VKTSWVAAPALMLKEALVPLRPLAEALKV
jgi:hypothetical protein